MYLKNTVNNEPFVLKIFTLTGSFLLQYKKRNTLKEFYIERKNFNSKIEHILMKEAIFIMFK